MLQEKLHTERLLLRRLSEADLADLHQLLANPLVGVWLGKPKGFTLSQSKDFLDRVNGYWEQYGYGPWGLFERKTHKFLGYCGLRYTEKLEATELLYSLDPSCWKKGYTTEASRKALELAKSQLNLSSVIAYTLPNNKASRAVMEKLGMQYVKDFVHADLLHVFYTLSL